MDFCHLDCVFVHVCVCVHVFLYLCVTMLMYMCLCVCVYFDMGTIFQLPIKICECNQ